MKKYLVLFWLFVCMAALVGCGGQEISDFVESDVKNVEVRVENVSPAGVTLTIKDTNAEPYVYGEWYEVNRLENGNWCVVEPIIEAYGFTEIGYIVDENGLVKFDVDWTWLYGELPAGHYRILKQAGQKTIAAEFAVE